MGLKELAEAAGRRAPREVRRGVLRQTVNGLPVEVECSEEGGRRIASQIVEIAEGPAHVP